MSRQGSSRGAAAGRLGVVVVHFGDVAHSERCLRSIAADTSPVRRTVVVVDNSPPSATDLESDEPMVRVVSCPDNPGFGGGANRGVRELAASTDRGGELLGYVFLNHDIELLPGYLDAVVEALADDGVGAAAGPIYAGGPDGDLWYAGGEFRVLTGTVRHHVSAEEAARRRDVSFLPGAALAVATCAWEEVGGFDERFFLYHEDVDLCLRLRRAGWKLRFEPGMRSVHRVGAATGSGELSPFFLENLIATRLRPHPSFLYRLYLALLHTPHEILRAVQILGRQGRAGLPRARAVLRGQCRALADLLRRR